MKKLALGLWLLAVAALFITVFSLGCGQTSSTTTATVSAAQTSAAKTGVLIASGGSAAGSSAGGISSSTSQNVTTGYSVRSATAGGPPTAFFTANLLSGTASTDGYVSCLAAGETASSNMSPYMRLYTKGGSVIKGTYLQNKKILNLPNFSVADLFSSTPGSAPTGLTQAISSCAASYATAYLSGGSVQPFDNSSIFRQITNEAEYMCWAYMYGSMESAVNASGRLPAGTPYMFFTTSEATANDKIGSMEMKIVFANSATGEISFLVDTDGSGKPVAGAKTGSGTLYTSLGSMDTTLQMNFGAGGPPSSVTVIGTLEVTPSYTVIINMSPATMTATGEVRDSSGTLIGTLEGSSTGGNVFIGSTSEAFTF